MQTAAASAAETGTLPSLLPLQAWSESAWDVSSGKIPSTVTSRSLQKRRYGGVRGLNIGVAALAAVVAVAAGFLVLRCAVYLRNASRSRGELRFLAEGRWSDESRGNPCHLPQERPPAGAAAAGEYEQVDEGPLAANDLLLKAKIYTGKLMEMVDGSQSVLWSLPPVLRARCLAALLVLLVVELAALFSLLERRERQVLEAGVHGMYGRIWDMRNSVENEDVTSSRQRHIRWLHITFGNLHEIDPTPERYPQRDWLMELHNLLQLQETALEQVKRGIAGLRQCVNSDRTNDDANPDDAAEDADVAGSSTPAAASDGATEERLDATVTAMVTTIHLRRNQVLSDPLLSEWLRMHHHGTHYALVRRQALQKLINQPLQAHSKLLGDLRSTPLGSGKEPWLGKKKENQPAFTRPQRSRENAYARPEDRRSAPASRQQHTFLRQGSHTGAGAELRSDCGGSDGGRLAFSPPVSNADVDSARSAPTPIFSSTFPFVATAVSTSFTAPHHLAGFPEGSQTTTDATGSARTSPPPTTLVFNDDDIDADTAASERTRGPLQAPLCFIMGSCSCR
ncbi:hypothetical protein EMWEY_00036380 [Eimeria maxima]|uniref:Uncharacterized protein n=1 Tax=Eimeria maxima TaxID=5804 RepID=U6MCY2_EIMMA|nr:hypothetical protein EMWEY_00036380 [Eimeria maxima]CDJ60933.1 hypothetical protein EMWEY_00036380 [Eimeria maxima]